MREIWKEFRERDKKKIIISREIPAVNLTTCSILFKEYVDFFIRLAVIFNNDLIYFFRDLSKINGLKNIIIESFNHNSEEVKSAASYALGNISLGNLGDYVPYVLNEIEAQPKRQYLLLHSLKEVRSFFLKLYWKIFYLLKFFFRSYPQNRDLLAVSKNWLLLSQPYGDSYSIIVNAAKRVCIF